VPTSVRNPEQRDRTVAAVLAEEIIGISQR
jgi:hypothetical protein